MGLKNVFLVALLVSAVSAQHRVCIPETLGSSVCENIGKDNTEVQCLPVESRVDCALRMAYFTADLGYYSEEETLLISQMQANYHRVIATVRDVNKLDAFSFEAVAIVPATHTNGLAGLSGAAYCHPGLDQTEYKWSPRVLKTLETLAARSNRCPNADTDGKTAEELEVAVLNSYFSAACRPGPWSANATVDADLKSRYPNLCSLCGTNSGCSSYTIDMGQTVTGVDNDNRHIQALECLRVNANSNSRSAVAYVEWQHVVEYFTLRNPGNAASFAVLCSNGTTVPLTDAVLASATSPCALVRQPWGTIVAPPNTAFTLLANLRTWWPNGVNPGGNTWQSVLFNVLTDGRANARVVFEQFPVFPVNYASAIRPMTAVSSSVTCLPARRWCTLTSMELVKCFWMQSASHILGLQPPISCLLRSSVTQCLSDIKNDVADFISADSNYGYLARQLYGLTPVKLVQNSEADATKIAAFVKETASSSLTSFGSLSGRKACFPAFGGLAYMSFVRAAQDLGVLSTTQCDYARVVGEFFNGVCAPGASDALTGSTFDSSVLCSACKSVDSSAQTCAWDNTNMYFGNNGSLACLADANNDVAFLNVADINTHLSDLGLAGTQFRALCRNNTLAANSGVTLDDNCLLAKVVDAEVLTRRNDPLYNSLNALLDSYDNFFGYNADGQLINFKLFSTFNGNNNLLFKDTTIGLTEPTTASTHEPAVNLIQLFQRLQTCLGAA